jgi:hypothetical protein
MDPAVRLHFVADEAEYVEELVAIYRDGTVDHWTRAR